MLTTIKRLIVNYLNCTSNQHAMEAMSMTLHDCIRLIEASKQSAAGNATHQSLPTALYMKRNLESLQLPLIKSA